MKAVSLFSGIGGFEIAMQRAGIEVVASCEIDKKARQLLQARFPLTNHYEDVTKLTGEQLKKDGYDGSNGIITAGFPCQDLSVAGRRAGLKGERSGLFWEIARILEETKAKYFIIENVPGLLSSSKGRDMGIVIGTLAELGYGVAWRVLDAQYFGVPQRRRRVFIVGCLDNPVGAGEILFERNGLRRDIAQSKQERQNITSSSARSVNLASGKEIANTIPAELYHHGSVVNQDVNNGHLVIEKNNVVNSFTGSSFGQYKKGVGTLRANGGDLGGGSENLVTTNGVRRLTPIECERLQGFPDGWTAGQPDSARYKQLGNAVTVPVVEWIINRVVKLSMATEANSKKKLWLD